jgi:hypothetical protein
MRTSTDWSQRYLSATALKLHLTLLLAGGGCLAAGWFEWTRALAGREVAWVYAFEWPFFALAGSVLWWRLLPAAPVRRDSSRVIGHPTSADGPARRNVSQAVSASDIGLIAWQEYLARLQASDPPGGPPSRR